MRKAGQERADADREHMQEKFGTNQQRMEAVMKETNANQAKADAEWKAWRAKMAAMLENMDANHGKMMSITRKRTMACLETKEARLEEKKPISVDTKPEAVQKEVPKEDAAVKPVRGPKKKRHKDRKLAPEPRSPAAR
jgi:predicted phage tail protein